jgi:hypothetical protein
VIVAKCRGKPVNNIESRELVQVAFLHKILGTKGGTAKFDNQTPSSFYRMREFFIFAKTTVHFMKQMKNYRRRYYDRTTKPIHANKV